VKQLGTCRGVSWPSDAGDVVSAARSRLEVRVADTMIADLGCAMKYRCLLAVVLNMYSLIRHSALARRRTTVLPPTDNQRGAARLALRLLAPRSQIPVVEIGGEVALLAPEAGAC
jgi:hypothetical protein